MPNQYTSIPSIFVSWPTFLSFQLFNQIQFKSINNVLRKQKANRKHPRKVISMDCTSNRNTVYQLQSKRVGSHSVILFLPLSPTLATESWSYGGSEIVMKLLRLHHKQLFSISSVTEFQSPRFVTYEWMNECVAICPVHYRSFQAPCELTINTLQ